jgi:hypothetical protein
MRGVHHIALGILLGIAVLGISYVAGASQSKVIRDSTIDADVNQTYMMARFH